MSKIIATKYVNEEYKIAWFSSNSKTATIIRNVIYFTKYIVCFVAIECNNL